MKKITFVLALLGTSYAGFSQETYYFTDPNRAMREAVTYFQKEQYSLAYPILKQLSADLRDKDRVNQPFNYQELKYYTIVCALKQNESAAISRASEFIDVEDNAARVQMMHFHLAEFYFRQENYALALQHYELANISNLSNTEIAKMKFNKGYSYFVNKNFNAAAPLFDDIRQISSDPHYFDANYYYGFINYSQKKWANALSAFNVVETHEEYGKVVPYYLASIHYLQGRKDRAVQVAEAGLKKAQVEHKNELHQILGHAYFEQRDFDKALPHLEKYVNSVDKVTRADIYELSYCYYQQKQWNNAISGFKQISGKEDSLAQHAMYLLGDAYLKLNDKPNARNAFLFCSVNSSNQEQREISMFNYAKLSYELGYQDIALNELQKFTAEFPNSTYSNEAKELLISVLANTNNYRDALAVLESLSNPSVNAQRLTPRIQYGRATELINDGMLVGAYDLLTKAEQHPQNASIISLVYYWKGELAYRLNRPDEAIRYFNLYQQRGAVAQGEASSKNAFYTAGYAYLKKEEYNSALQQFQQVVRNASRTATPVEQDAYVRAADCYYMSKQYATAKTMYENVINYGWGASDYASFQRAMIAGVNSPSEKIKLLNSFNQQYPNSSLALDANMEAADSYLANQQYQLAVPYLKKIVESDNPSLKSKAQLKLGIAYYNLDQTDLAVQQFNTLLKTSPNSVEANSALEGLKAIYIEQGKSNEYVALARSLGKDVSASQEESLIYDEIESLLNRNNQSGALAKLNEYLTKFPNGQYQLDALYFTAQIYDNQKNWEKAAVYYDQLSEIVPHKYAETALLRSARLHYFDLKNIEKAEGYFHKLTQYATTQEHQLEAYRGLVRTQYQLEKFDQALETANHLLKQKGIGSDDKIIANMAIAKSYHLSNDYAKAIQQYKQVAGLSKAAYGAEARYAIAEILFKQNKLTEAEEAALEVIDKSGSYEDWVVKSYLLLGDIYFAEKDYFNAKATFESVVENTSIESLKAIAQQKLEEVKNAERSASKVSQ
ncbi:tetratricopeptide repeat protein [Gynurincola endophyticus]|uniref:tetratricopeptide repeat protein n=1 Tax=Gynurincola endophyticus TaxID=2479004 RepID=UPI000F8C8AD5|nr:tetratricopeptide repeat protein [Gynurincola endophyticus]